MTDKKTFGSFIKQKRTEKNYSQKDLADKLFVTEGAVSKWERGISYPDITLITAICEALEISEHELITASTDTDTGRLKQEARKFRMIRGVWFWVPTIAYAVALLTCFICNLAVNHTLSWFFIVLTALVCAYAFVPTFTSFVEKNKLPVFAVTSYFSICLLLLACAAYTNGWSWLLTACIGTLMGYTSVFVPIFLSKTKLSRYKFVISFGVAFLLTVLLLLNIHVWHPFKLGAAVWITGYAFVPAILMAYICTRRFDAFFKAGICTAGGAVVYYFTEHVVDVMFGTNDGSYQVNFKDWSRCPEGNIALISLLSLLLISVVFIGVGVVRKKCRDTRKTGLNAKTE